MLTAALFCIGDIWQYCRFEVYIVSLRALDSILACGCGKPSQMCLAAKLRTEIVSYPAGCMSVKILRVAGQR